MKRAAGLAGALSAVLMLVVPAADAAKPQILGKSGGFTYSRDVETLAGPGSGAGSASARCPKNMASVSGGGSISSEASDSYLATSTKTTLRNWLTEGWHVSADVPKVPSFAICTEKLGQYFDAGMAITAPAGPYDATNSTSCPGGNVVGGGVSLPDAPADWALHSMYPLDEGDVGDVPNDAWRGTVLHRAGTSVSTMQTNVFCLTGAEPVYVPKDETSSAPAKSVTAKCPAGSVVGRGRRVRERHRVRLALVKTVPYDSKDKGKVPDDGWTAKFCERRWPDELTYQAIAVCR